MLELKFLPPRSIRPGFFPSSREAERLKRSATLVDGKQLVAVCRINALWRLRCCALPVCGFGGEGLRYPAKCPKRTAPFQRKPLFVMAITFSRQRRRYAWVRGDWTELEGKTQTCIG